jgi:hypothetical protein
MSPRSSAGNVEMSVVIRALMAVVLVIAVLLIGWSLFSGGEEPSKHKARVVAARADTAAQLVTDARAVGHAVWWAGARPATGYEFTQTHDGKVYVRYLPLGVKAGDPRPAFTTVATYPGVSALAAVKVIGQKPGAKLFKLPGGAFAVQNSATPRNAYMAFPGQPFQIEVFDPVPGQALKLIQTGKIKAVF